MANTDYDPNPWNPEDFDAAAEEALENALSMIPIVGTITTGKKLMANLLVMLGIHPAHTLLSDNPYYKMLDSARKAYGEAAYAYGMLGHECKCQNKDHECHCMDDAQKRYKTLVEKFSRYHLLREENYDALVAALKADFEAWYEESRAKPTRAKYNEWLDKQYDRMETVRVEYQKSLEYLSLTQKQKDAYIPAIFCTNT